MSAPQQSADEIFAAALEIPDPEQRRAYLDRACAGDGQLRQEVESLLAAHAPTSTFLEHGPLAAPGTLAITPEDAWKTPAIVPPSEKAGDRIGRYKLLEPIGEGGFGVVWMAEQEEPVRRRVALKIIKLGMDTRQVVARFEAERQALALMDHPNIARVFDGGATETGRPYFVMELVRGIPITEYCDGQKLSTVERLELFMQVCQAVQHAHQKGVIHRDLKPSNILVTEVDSKAVPKVIDFGVAKATQVRLTEKTVFTRFHQLIGTPAYMSPEQAGLGGLDIDTRSDVYALGVVLYELLTGRTPFDPQELLAQGYDAILRMIREEEPKKPSTRLSTLTAEELVVVAGKRKAEPARLNRLVRGDLDWIVMKALEKDRKRRYETATTFAEDLLRHLRQDPVLAAPPSAAYRLRRFARRNRLLLATGSAVALAVLTGSVVSVWQAARATRAERAQRELRQQADNQRQRAEAGEKNAQHNLYLANMNLMQQAWEQSDVGRVRQLLEETATYPGRGFEWYYWQRQTHLELKTLRGHIGRVLSLAFSPDGQRIVTGGWDSTAKVWETASGLELLTLKGHTNGITSVAFSPDGGWIFTRSWMHTAKLWEATSGRELRSLTLMLRQHSVAFSPDGQRIVTGGMDGTAKVWEATNSRELLTLQAHSSGIETVNWPVKVAGDGNSVLQAHSGGIETVNFSPDGQRIATGSYDNTAKVWDVASGRELLTLKGHSSVIYSVAFSLDGQRIVTGSGDKTAKVWETGSGRELITLKGHTREIRAVAFSPDGQRVATAGEDRAAKVWEAVSGREMVTLKGAIGPLAFSPDGQRLVTGGWDGTAKVWGAASWEQLPPKGPIGYANFAALSPDARRLVTAGSYALARVWEVASGKELLTVGGNEIVTDCVAFSPDGQRIVTGEENGTAKVWEAVNGQELFSFKMHTAAIRCVAFSPDGQRIFSGSSDRTAKVWEAASGKKLLALKGHTGGIWAVAFSPDGQRIVTGGRGDDTATVWDAVSGRELLALKGHTGGIWSVAFSPDGRWIISGCEDKTAKVWETASGRQLLTLKGHSDRVFSVAFSADGQRIVTGSYQMAKVWEAPSGRELLSLKGQAFAILVAAFSPDGQRIVAGDSDSTIGVWEAASPGQVAAWQKEEQPAKRNE